MSGKTIKQIISKTLNPFAGSSLASDGPAPEPVKYTPPAEQKSSYTPFDNTMLDAATAALRKGVEDVGASGIAPLSPAAHVFDAAASTTPEAVAQKFGVSTGQPAPSGSSAAQAAARAELNKKVEPPVSDLVFGSPGRMVAATHSAPELSTPGDPSGMGNLGRVVALNRMVADKGQKVVSEAAKAEIAANQFQAGALGDVGAKVEASNARVDAVDRELRARGEAFQKSLDESNRVNSEPSKFFDPVTGGATGFLGFIARMAWALSTPEYQRNTIAAANSLADQDYKAKMLKRQTADGRVRASSDALAFWERRYKDKWQQEQAFKIDARQRMIDSIRAYGAQVSSPVIQARAEATIGQMEAEQEKDQLKLYGSTYKPARMVGGMPGLVRDHSGKITGIKGIGSDGSPIMVDAKDPTTTPHVRILLNGQERVLAPNSDTEATRLNEKVVTLNTAIRGLNEADNLLELAERAANFGDRQALMVEAQKHLGTVEGVTLEANKMGAPTGAEGDKISQTIRGGFEATDGFLKRSQKAINRMTRGMSPSEVKAFRSGLKSVRTTMDSVASTVASQYGQYDEREVVSQTGHKTKVFIPQQHRQEDTRPTNMESPVTPGTRR